MDRLRERVSAQKYEIEYLQDENFEDAMFGIRGGTIKKEDEKTDNKNSYSVHFERYIYFFFLFSISIEHLVLDLKNCPNDI